MNLTTEQWIPVVRPDGIFEKLSLRQVFEQGHELSDLAVRPHERIALMRLLICIAQAGLNGPNDEDDWRECLPRIAPAALHYLDRWKQSFELFGDGPRFLQVEKLERLNSTGNPEDDEGNSVSKLDLALATGNNTTLFDNAGGAERDFTPADLALMLLTFQCFSPGGRIGVARWKDQATSGNGSSNHAPCLASNMLHALLRGDTLLDTLHWNLLTKHSVAQLFGRDFWGKPVWESMPKSLGESAATKNATETYLGRLAPLSRAIRLSDDCRTLILANGLKYPQFPEWRESTATIVPNRGKTEPRVLNVSIERAIWREIPALAIMAVGKGSPGGPAVLRNVPKDSGCDLWVGGLASEKGKVAKPLDVVESVLHVPAYMLGEPCQRAYEQGVKYAESVELRLRYSVSVYHKELGDNLDRPDMKDRRLRIQNQAATHFWTDVEAAVPTLLKLVTPGLVVEWPKSEWGRTVRLASRAAYDYACAQETSRQIRAHALGLAKLYTFPAPSSKPETEKEAEV